MPCCIELIDPAGFADHASRILEEAWTPPALRYSPEYLKWQLTFPGTAALPAAAAFDGREPVGFAAITARRLRHRSSSWDSGIVSFVAVRPAWRNQGIAAGLYAVLLRALRNLSVPVITFAAAGSGGERTMLRAYPDAGIRMQPLGTYPAYGCMPRAGFAADDSEWAATICDDASLLPEIVARCAAETDLVWNDPTAEQVEHYFRDPRPRKFILLHHRDAGAAGAAWGIRADVRTARGIEHVPTIDCLFLSREHAGALPALFRCAAMCWPGAEGQPAIISAPSLYGFDPVGLRAAGIRQIGAVFGAHLCAADLPRAMAEAHGTNLEVV